MLTIYQDRLKARVKPLDESLKRIGLDHLVESEEPEEEPAKKEEACARRKAVQLLKRRK